MIALLVIVWGLSAAFCWEAQVEALHGRQRRWDAITIGSLVPIYNTVVAVSYLFDKWKARTE